MLFDHFLARLDRLYDYNLEAGYAAFWQFLM